MASISQARYQVVSNYKHAGMQDDVGHCAAAPKVVSRMARPASLCSILCLHCLCLVLRCQVLSASCCYRQLICCRHPLFCCSCGRCYSLCCISVANVAAVTNASTDDTSELTAATSLGITKTSVICDVLSDQLL